MSHTKVRCQAPQSKEIAPRCRTRIVPTPPHVIYKKKSSPTNNRGMLPQKTAVKNLKKLSKENKQVSYTSYCENSKNVSISYRVLMPGK